MSSNVLDFINLIQFTFGRYRTKSGGCLLFHFILKNKFDGTGFYDSNHVITKIGDYYYDIDGLAVKTEKFLPLEEYGLNHFIESFGRIIPKELIIKNLKDIDNKHLH